MAELDVGQHCEVLHCRQRGDAGNPIPARGRAGPGSDGRGGGGGASKSFPEKRWAANGVEQGFPSVLSTTTLVNIIKERPKIDEHKPYPCSFKDCTEVELVTVVCPYCEKNFCLRHRHQSDHGCEKLEIPQPRMTATQKLVKDIIDSKSGGAVSKGRKGAKTSGTAAKVALMKLKMHADGDKSLPQTERIYFQVYLPKGSKEKSKAMFFCLQWSIGKVVDFAASLAGLRNENNKLMAKKLRLCHIPSGEALPLDHTLETWITKEDCPLYNGGSVILEYLNDEEQFLKNVDSYLE